MNGYIGLAGYVSCVKVIDPSQEEYAKSCLEQVHKSLKDTATR